jgi:all-trans-8'-apo-beta-carotenal 15,15'-oxygenase
MNNHAPGLEILFDLPCPENSYALKPTAGALPTWLDGTYYVNGPARFRRGEQRYRHWLDGDGMVASIRFSRGQAQFTNRFVRSTKFVAEEDAGHFIFRTFGTSFNGDQLKRGIGLESPVNVSVFPWNGTLLAFGEQGLPWELDPTTLETRGEYTFGGRLNAISPLSAHPCFCPVEGEMFNFGISFASRQPCLHFYRFSPSGEPIYRKRVAIDFPCSVHDFGLSSRYAVFYLSPYLLDVGAMMRQGKTVMETLSWEPERGSQLLIVDRETGERVASVALGERYCLHLIGCFEREGSLVVDVVELDQPVYDQYEEIPDLFTEVAPGRPVRFEIDLETWQLVNRRQLPYDRAPDFPAVDSRLATGPYRHFWMLGISTTGQQGRKFFDQLAHLDWENPTDPVQVYQPTEKGIYLGCEPTFLGHPEDPKQGMVLLKQFDAKNRQDTFLFFDAFDITRGPIAQLPLRDPLPPGFHACFEPSNSLAAMKGG